MKFRLCMLVLAGAAVFPMAAAAQSAGDADAGKKVFNKCRACHVPDKPQNRVGPHLMGIAGRTPGTVEDYRYSDAMKAFGEEHVWDDATLADYLAAPRDFVEGTKMAFPGLKDDEDIADVIAYMKQFGPPS